MIQNVRPVLLADLKTSQALIPGSFLEQSKRDKRHVSTTASRRHAAHTSSDFRLGAAEQRHGQASDVVNSIKTPISQIARQKQADKEFFTSLLSSAATKRDAKAYISRLKNGSQSKSSSNKLLSQTPSPRPQVNLGGLYGTVRAVEQSPIFSHYEPEHKGFEVEEALHVALIKIRDLHQIRDNVVVGIAETMCQLARLSMSPCVVLESSLENNEVSQRKIKQQAERLISAIDNMSDVGARLVEDAFEVSESGVPELSLAKLLLTPLRRGLIPVIVPCAYLGEEQKVVSIPADEAVLALVRKFASPADPGSQAQKQTLCEQVSLDRIIVVDRIGGVPNSTSADGQHVFLNLEQEYSAVAQQLANTKNDTHLYHLQHLAMLREALRHLSPSASGLIVAPEDAANMSSLTDDVSPSMVGTRRQKNALIHNLLTDKPAYSSSLPKSRLSKSFRSAFLPSVATFVKHGMPLMILPDPSIQPWTPSGARLKLTDKSIDLKKLVFLIDDSFNRNLDTEHYLRRVNDRIAGVIIAGDYEGGAILTWETPPLAHDNDTDRLVPYLDKFAVLKRSQGAGGVADILFNAMVRTCFPDGVCWRSRKNNPVNKWYFERSLGTKKIPDMNWTMFWTTPGVAEESQRFQDYENVCRGVEPSWLDTKQAAD